MGEIFAAMTNFLKEKGIPFHRSKSNAVLRVHSSGEKSKWTRHAEGEEEQEQFVFYSLCPFKVPEDDRPAIPGFLGGEVKSGEWRPWRG